MRRVRAALLALAVILSSLAGGRITGSQAAAESPYRVSEFPIRVAPGLQGAAAISGKWVLWQEESGNRRSAAGRNLETGLDFALDSAGFSLGLANIGGDTVVEVESNNRNENGVFGYKLPDGRRFAIAPLKSSQSITRSGARTDGRLVVWSEGVITNSDIYAYEVVGQRATTVSTQLSYQEYPAVSGNIVVWLDNRNAPPERSYRDVYGYDLSTGQEFRLTSKPEYLSAPAISGNTVVWSVHRDRAYLVEGYDLARRQAFTIAQMPPVGGISSPSMDGDLVVWGAQGENDLDVLGYDLKQSKQFIISRAIGGQGEPRISGRNIVWVDSRNSGLGRYDYDSDIFGAKLEPGPAPVPPIVGAPDAADAKVEVVWPHGGASVAEADKANVGVWLFLSDTLKLPPCQWSPRVRLWKATNNEPARRVEVDPRKVARYFAGPDPSTGVYAPVPSYDFNDVDVAAARDPNSRQFFFATVEGMPGRQNILAHAADARTHYPRQDLPSGVAPVTGAVDAKIKIVWPHDGAPVEQARQVNISSSLFSPGTLQSVPPDWNPTVRLYRSLNNEVSREIATGRKRLALAGSLNHPVWDFDNVDVVAANDPVNKYYFTLSVDGVTTCTNVWSHGADARTYFPQVDTPTQACR